MKSTRALFYLALISPALIALAGPYLPFQDWPGHLGTSGAFLHLGDPAARLDEYYAYRGPFQPNALFYWGVWGLAALFSPVVAAVLALILSVGLLGPAMAYFLRGCGADERLAFLALPLAIGRHVYCGFLPNAAALVVLLLAFGLYFRLSERPRWFSALGLLVLLVVLHAFHAFVYLAGAGLLLLAIAIDLVSGRWRAAGLSGGATLLSSIVFIPHFLKMDARAGGGPGALESLYRAVLSEERTGLLTTFWEWLFASYRYAKIDDVLQGVWAVALLVLITWGVIFERRPARARLVAMIGATLVMFVALPSYIGPPLSWWGGNLRLPIIAVLLAIGVAGPLRRTWAAGVLAHALLCVGLATFDLVRFARVEMAGFGEVLDAIPPGQRLTLLHWTPKEVYEYPGEPHGYASNYYLFEKGGLVPQNMFEHPDCAFSRKASAPAPPWGRADGFDWYRHGIGYDAFLVRVHPEYEHSPLHGENQKRVELVKAAGNWRYYRARTSSVTTR